MRENRSDRARPGNLRRVGAAAASRWTLLCRLRRDRQLSHRGQRDQSDRHPGDQRARRRAARKPGGRLRREPSRKARRRSSAKLDSPKLLSNISVSLHLAR